MKIPFPSFTLGPSGPSDIEALPSEVIDEDARYDILDHYDSYIAIHGTRDLSKPSHKFFFIPYKDHEAILAKYGLKLPEQSAFWLPSAASGNKFLEIMRGLPSKLKDITLIAYDHSFSVLAKNRFLVLDLSMNFPTIVTWLSDELSFSRNPRLYLIAEEA